MSIVKAPPDTRTPKLYHTPSSYFSMIARLALAEAGIGYEPVFVDILFQSSQQFPTYAQLNPNMTVPTLMFPERILDQSRDIPNMALTGPGQQLDAETTSWIELHYSYPIEELTFGGFLAHLAPARVIVLAKMAATRRRLLRLATTYPDLAEIYRKRAAVFAERERTFDSKPAMRLGAKRREEAIGLLDRLERHFTDGRGVMVPLSRLSLGAPRFAWCKPLMIKPALDFESAQTHVSLLRLRRRRRGVDGLSRPHGIRRFAEGDRRPALTRYWQSMKARRSFVEADIRTKLHVGRLIRGIIHG